MSLRGGFGQRQKPLASKQPLKADPEKTRAWQQRTRTKGLTTGAQPARTGGDRGKTPQRSSSNEVPSSVRARVYERDGNRCVRCGKRLESGNRQLQHRLARGRGGNAAANTASNLILLCGFSATDPDGCHTWVEAHPDASRPLGYRVPLAGDPRELSVVYSPSHGGGRWLLDDQGDRRRVA